MSRAIGEFGVQEFVPEWAALIVALVTQLGDIWFVSVLLGWLYLRTRRDEVAVRVAQTVGAIGLLYVLKYLFAYPRPDQTLVALEQLPAVLRPLYASTAHADGYGFPSGHALVTTVVYVGLARTLSVGTARRRYLAAGTVVAAVSLSRVLLGVHYLVDVLAGVAVGLVYLAATSALFEEYGDRHTLPFVVAFALSVVAVFVTGFHLDALALLAVAFAALVLSRRPSVGRSVVGVFD